MSERRLKTRPSYPALLLELGLAMAVSACAVGPDYMKPSAPEPVRYKELKGWKRATPMDAIDRGTWWAAFKDAELGALESRVVVSNQTIIQAEAAYRTAQALVKEAQAGLFPTVTANYANTGAHSGSKTSGFSTGQSTTLDTFSTAANALWTPDIWGKVRR